MSEGVVIRKKNKEKKQKKDSNVPKTQPWLCMSFGERSLWSVLFLRMSVGSMLPALGDRCKRGPNLHAHSSPAPLNVYLRCIFMYRGHLS